MNRRSSRHSFANAQYDILEELEAVKKKYVQANRQIAKMNAQLSLTVEALTEQVNALTGENLRLRASELALAAQLRRERDRTRRIFHEAETATIGLVKRFGSIRQSHGLPAGTSPPSPTVARGPAKDSVVRPLLSSLPPDACLPPVARLSRPPAFDGICEEEEGEVEIELGRPRELEPESPISTTISGRKSSSKSGATSSLSTSGQSIPKKPRHSNSRLPIPVSGGSVPQLDLLELQQSGSSAPGSSISKHKPPTRRQSGLLANMRGVQDDIPRSPSPAFGGSPLRLAAAADALAEAAESEYGGRPYDQPESPTPPPKSKSRSKAHREHERREREEAVIEVLVEEEVDEEAEMERERRAQEEEEAARRERREKRKRAKEEAERELMLVAAGTAAPTNEPPHPPSPTTVSRARATIEVLRDSDPPISASTTERKRERDFADSALLLRDVTNSPRGLKIAVNVVEPVAVGSANSSPASSALSAIPSECEETTPATTPFQSSDAPAGSSSPVNGKSDSEAAANARERRTRRSVSSVNYAEPKLNTKMRKPDPADPAPNPYATMQSFAPTRSRPSSVEPLAVPTIARPSKSKGAPTGGGDESASPARPPPTTKSPRSSAPSKSTKHERDEHPPPPVPPLPHDFQLVAERARERVARDIAASPSPEQLPPRPATASPTMMMNMTTSAAIVTSANTNMVRSPTRRKRRAASSVAAMKLQHMMSDNEQEQSDGADADEEYGTGSGPGRGWINEGGRRRSALASGTGVRTKSSVGSSSGMEDLGRRHSLAI